MLFSSHAGGGGKDFPDNRPLEVGGSGQLASVHPFFLASSPLLAFTCWRIARIAISFLDSGGLREFAEIFCWVSCDRNNFCSRVTAAGKAVCDVRCAMCDGKSKDRQSRSPADLTWTQAIDSLWPPASALANPFFDASFPKRCYLSRRHDVSNWLPQR